METELRQVTIEEYWPLIVRNTEEFGQIAVAENPEFNKLASCIYQVLQETFVRDATEYGVGRWENILKISPESGDTLEDRKARILTYLNVKLPYTVRVLRQMLVGLLGEENFTLTFDNDTSTLKVALALDTTQAQVTDVQTLLDRVLPRNLVTEMEWINGLPMDYTPLEYLESSGTQRIKLPYQINDAIGLEGEYIDLTANYDSPYMSYTRDGTNVNDRIYLPYTSHGVAYYGWGSWVTFARFSNVNLRTHASINLYNSRVWEYKDTKRELKGTIENAITYTGRKREINLFYYHAGGSHRGFIGRGFFAKVTTGENVDYSLVPALDPTGTPCMFDLVTRKAFYNSGTGDFLYPGAEQAVQTTDLDATSYAKLTENGVRRLYKVPKGYNGSIDAYAAANGFKELVEPPMPSEGYWTPEWRETETQLICDWVETEPPTEEVTENE